MIIGIILSAVCLVISIICCIKFGSQAKHFKYISQNKQTTIERLNEECKSLKWTADQMSAALEQKTEMSKQMESTIAEYEEQQKELARIRAQQEYNEITQALKLRYQDLETGLEKEYRILFDDLFGTSREIASQVRKEKEELNSLQSKQQAYVQAQLHKEEMLKQKDFYRLVLSEADEADIALLRDLQIKFSRKNVIDKLIWEVYYKPAFDTLVSHLFQDGEVITGIYKITNIETEKAYIGKSVDVKERWRTHLKTALSSDTSTNKLYQEMKKYTPQKFFWEILERVPRDKLDEREAYWIDFYDVQNYGLNSQRGNQK